VYFSVLFDLPTGAAIVCTFGAVLIVMFFVHLLLSRRHKILTEDATPVRHARQHVPQ
jgi:ABC-type Mn2+/Zn2+ transport system permease subunit